MLSVRRAVLLCFNSDPRTRTNVHGSPRPLSPETRQSFPMPPRILVRTLFESPLYSPTQTPKSLLLELGSHGLNRHQRMLCASHARGSRFRDEDMIWGSQSLSKGLVPSFSGEGGWIRSLGGFGFWWF